MKKAKKTVLITGPTSGIGFELAKLFAEDNFNLVLVSRDESSLNKTAVYLNGLGARNTTVIAKDLSKAGAAQEVYEETQKKGIEIDILVNNAGVGERGLFLENDLEKELAMIQLNITSLVHLTKLYLKDMRKMGEGKILNLASVASYQPTPMLAVYAATKAFILSFTDALVNELKNENITLTALIPGPTDTEFFKNANAENTKAAQDDPEDPAVVAKIGYQALLNGDTHAVAPGMRMMIVMSTALPNQKVASKAREYMEEESTKK